LQCGLTLNQTNTRPLGDSRVGSSEHKGSFLNDVLRIHVHLVRLCCCPRRRRYRALWLLHFYVSIVVLDHSGSATFQHTANQTPHTETSARGVYRLGLFYLRVWCQRLAACHVAHCPQLVEAAPLIAHGGDVLPIPCRHSLHTETALRYRRGYAQRSCRPETMCTRIIS
jgi:hypothetical protein